MKVCVPIDEDGRLDPRWGRAQRVAVADVADGRIGEWQEFVVSWDRLHDEGTEGAHHARIARFLIDHEIRVVAVAHVGPGMRRMLDAMGVRLVEGLSGTGQAAALAGAA